MDYTNVDYTNPYGIWEVTTEGDCEGRTTRKLGIFEGYVDEIAFALSDKVYYSLRFKKISKIIDNIPICRIPKNEVSISFDIESKTWDIYGDKLVQYFNKVFNRRKVNVKSGNFFASVVLERDIPENEKRKIALSKLTEEEKELLGLKED